MGAECSCENAVMGKSGSSIMPGSPKAALRLPKKAAKYESGDGAFDAPLSTEVLMAKVKTAIRKKCKSRKEAWKTLDVNNDVRIDRLEFQRWLLDDIGFPLADQIDRVFLEVDSDEDGVVSPLEFKVLFDSEAEPDAGPEADSQEPVGPTALVKQLSTQMRDAFSTWKAALEAINTSKTGSISKQELRSFLVKEFGFESPQTINRLFNEIDADGNGQISAAELRAAFDAAAKGRPDEEAGAKAAKRTVLSRRGSTLSTEVEETTSQREEVRGLEHFRNFMKTRFSGAKEAFQHIDIDSDKQLDRQELTKVLEDMEYTGDANAVFNGLDADKDGFVTREEFKQQLKAAVRKGRSAEPCAAAGA
mmetsp:Transcript_92733/g.276578  ORF Transcript_92733/g.276578 Transcript_92733/m.276578 type:complete len:362 (-) Transcript_92733:68-1153(-)